MAYENNMYAKLFASLYQGTLRGNSHGILVFTNLLAHADRDGYVDKHFRAIADEVGLTTEEVKVAIEMLESPDSESRSSELDGRRITRINDHRAWGWHIVNYAKYREIRNDEDRREANRVAQQRWREKHKPSVMENNGDKPREREMDTEKQKDQYSVEFIRFWLVYPRKIAKEKAWKAWKKIKLTPDLLLKILSAVENQTPKWTKAGIDFVPHASTWLNDSRWDDDLAPSFAVAQTHEGGGW